ncbi:hypothetical protein C0J52_00719 [Blattella germanica]|nr:hypothetical protein C0J52_00719 [Blattella germanica]
MAGGRLASLLVSLLLCRRANCAADDTTTSPTYPGCRISLAEHLRHNSRLILHPHSNALDGHRFLQPAAGQSSLSLEPHQQVVFACPLGLLRVRVPVGAAEASEHHRHHVQAPSEGHGAQLREVPQQRASAPGRGPHAAHPQPRVHPPRRLLLRPQAPHQPLRQVHPHAGGPGRSERRQETQLHLLLRVPPALDGGLRGRLQQKAAVLPAGAGAGLPESGRQVLGPRRRALPGEGALGRLQGLRVPLGAAGGGAVRQRGADVARHQAGQLAPPRGQHQELRQPQGQGPHRLLRHLRRARTAQRQRHQRAGVSGRRHAGAGALLEDGLRPAHAPGYCLRRHQQPGRGPAAGAVPSLRRRVPQGAGVVRGLEQDEHRHRLHLLLRRARLLGRHRRRARVQGRRPRPAHLTHFLPSFLIKVRTANAHRNVLAQPSPAALQLKHQHSAQAICRQRRLLSSCSWFSTSSAPTLPKKSPFHTLSGPESDHMTFNAGEGVRFACPDADTNRLVIPNSMRSLSYEAIAYCVQGSTFAISALPYEFGDIRCQKPPQSTIQEQRRCEVGDGKLLNIGFKLKRTFLGLIQVCFDPVKHATVSAMHLLSKNIKRRENDVSRTSYFSAASFGKDLMEVPNVFYTCKKQIDNLGFLLGSRAQAQKYLVCGSYYLARGHLAPNADFMFGYQQKATSYYVNTAPQWHTINSGNWKLLEASVRKYASDMAKDLTVVTGTLDVASLPDATGTEHNLYMTTTADLKPAVPVPALLWKLVLDKSTQRGIVFVGVNDPHPSGRRRSVICKDVCDATTSWFVGWDRHKVPRGLIYCCTVDDFASKSGIKIPFRVRGLLL